jgi:hypothetical protein
MLNIVHYALIAIQTRTEFIFLEKIRNCKLSAIGFCTTSDFHAVLFWFV